MGNVWVDMIASISPEVHKPTALFPDCHPEAKPKDPRAKRVSPCRTGFAGGSSIRQPRQRLSEAVNLLALRMTAKAAG
jgi:hypothetical protein